MHWVCKTDVQNTSTFPGCSQTHVQPTDHAQFNTITFEFGVGRSALLHRFSFEKNHVWSWSQGKIICWFTGQIFNPIKVHGGLQTYSNTSVQKLCPVQRSIAATTVKLAITRHGLHSHLFSISSFCHLPSWSWVYPYLILPFSLTFGPNCRPLLQLGPLFFWRSTFSLSATVGQWALAFHAPPPGTGWAKHEDEKVWKISQVDDESIWSSKFSLHLIQPAESAGWTMLNTRLSSKRTFCPF